MSAIFLESGCVKDVGSVSQCDGAWADGKWKVTTGEIFDFFKDGESPKQLIANVANLSSNKFRAGALKNHIFMGVSSYMACYPPEKTSLNIMIPDSILPKLMSIFWRCRFISSY